MPEEKTVFIILLWENSSNLLKFIPRAGYSSKHLVCINSFKPYNNFMRQIHFFPTFIAEKIRQRVFKQFAQGHRADFFFFFKEREAKGNESLSPVMVSVLIVIR